MTDSIVLYRYERVISHLRRLLDEQDMTQKELAERTGISESHVSRALSEDREASYDKIYRMWTVLKQEEAEERVTAEDVMEGKIEWASPDETVGEVVNVRRKWHTPSCQ